MRLSAGGKAPGFALDDDGGQPFVVDENRRRPLYLVFTRHST